MDPELLKRLLATGAGIVAGALGYSVFAGRKNDPIYTGLSREYKVPDRNMAASVWALPSDGYIIRFEELKRGNVVNPFPDFESPVFMMPFAAALYADEIAWNLGYDPVGVWAASANEAAETRAKERVEMEEEKD